VVEAVEENMDEKDRMRAEELEPGIWNRSFDTLVFSMVTP
jgi:hypothetical protein